MKQKNRILALLLCLCLALSLLSGCGGKEVQPEATSVPTAAPTPSPTPEPDYGAIYDEALAVYENAADLTMTVSIRSERSKAGHTAAETTERTVSYQGRGSDALIVKSSEVVAVGKARYGLDQIYAEGVTYAKIKTSRFVARTEEKLFLSTQVPARLFSSADFGKAAPEGESILFTEPLALPEWAAPEGAKLLDASAEARLSDGALRSLSYTVSYRFGGSEITDSYEVGYELPEGLDLSAEIPENAKGYETIDDIRAPMLLIRASEVLRQAENLDMSFEGAFVTYAGGVAIQERENAMIWGDDETMRGKTTANSTLIDLSNGRSYNHSYEESLADGVLTYTEGGETDSLEVENELVRAGLTEQRMEALPVYDQLTDATVTEAGDFLLIEFTASADYGDQLRKKVSRSIFQEEDYLESYASSYVTNKAEGYFALEKASYQPTALSIEYEGVHVIEGSPYQLQAELSYSYALDDPDTYEDIADEPLPDVEPEHKATPVFYEVTGENGEKMYLFGTIHIGDDRTGYLPDYVTEAFDAADALAVEFDDEAFYEQLAGDEELLQTVRDAYFYGDGSTISSHLDSEVYKAALLLMKATGQYSELSESLKPMFWSSSIENAYTSNGSRLCSSKGVDSRLMRLAREKEMPILNVESGEAQLSMLGGYSDELQELLLAETLSISRHTYLESIEELFESWCEGDEAKLIETLAAMSEEERSEIDPDELKLYDEYHSKMELERNAAMVEVAKGYLSGEQTVFFAVGLAHLLGEGGLVQALRDAGYTVTLLR